MEEMNDNLGTICWNASRQLAGDTVIIYPMSSRYVKTDGYLLYDHAIGILTWYTASGSKVVRRIACDKVPLGACICSFHGDISIAILISENILQLHMLTGETFDTILPYAMENLYVLENGLLLERPQDSADNYATTRKLHIDCNSTIHSNNGRVVSNYDSDICSWIQGGLQMDIDHAANVGGLFSEETSLIAPTSSPRCGINPREKAPFFPLSPNISVDPVEKCLNMCSRTTTLPFFFTLTHPSAPIRPVFLHTSGHSEKSVNSMDIAAGSIPCTPTIFNISNEQLDSGNRLQKSQRRKSSSELLKEDDRESLLVTHDDLIVTMGRSRKISIWQLRHFGCESTAFEGFFVGDDRQEQHSQRHLQQSFSTASSSPFHDGIHPRGAGPKSKGGSNNVKLDRKSVLLSNVIAQGATVDSSSIRAGLDEAGVFLPSEPESKISPEFNLVLQDSVIFGTTSETTGASSLEERNCLEASFSGSFDSLGGLMLHLVNKQCREHRCYRVVVVHGDIGDTSYRLVPLPPLFVGIGSSSVSAVPKKGELSGICGIAHMELALGTQPTIATATTTSIQESAETSAYRACPLPVLSAPITVMLHGQDAQSQTTDSTDHLVATLTLAGRRLGEYVLLHADDLDDYALEPKELQSKQSQLKSSNFLRASIRSIRPSAGSILLTLENAEQDVQVFVLSSPSLALEGPASINAITAHAICCALTTCELVPESSGKIRDGLHDVGWEAQGGTVGSLGKHALRTVLHDIAAEAVSLILLAQDKVGPHLALVTLIAVIFDLPPCALPTKKSNNTWESVGLDASRCLSFYEQCSDASIQFPGKVELTSPRCVIFDAIHSVLQDILARSDERDQLPPERIDALEVLCNTLLLAVSRVTDRGNTTTARQAHSYKAYYECVLKAFHRHPPRLYSKQDSKISAMSAETSQFTMFTTLRRAPSVLSWIADSFDIYVENTVNSRLTHSSSVALENLLFVPGLSLREDAETWEHPMVAYFPCPSLVLLRRFMEYMRRPCPMTLSETLSYHHDVDAIPLALRISDAFVRASGGRLSFLSLLPSPLRALIDLTLVQCRADPPTSWPAEVLLKIGRNDLCAHLLDGTHDAGIGLAQFLKANRDATMLTKPPQLAPNGVPPPSSSAVVNASSPSTSDGLATVEMEASRLRFADDDRVHEVCRMLRSSTNIYLRVEKTPEMTDHDYRHKLQMRLLILCRRSLALCVGRGALTIGSLRPLMAEALPCPPLVLNGRIPPSNSTFSLDTQAAPPELTLWPEFHNGVAAGLRVRAPSGHGYHITGNQEHVNLLSGGVTRNWILYNRAASGEASAFHAGVLLGLGLQGHLGVLSVTDICDYLTQGQETVAVALLVGLAATKRGTSDPMLSKTLCLHVPALLPPQHWDIEISPLTQTAALAGLGLLYCGSGHRLMTEFLLAELGRRPTPDRHESREALALSAAWALGMVLLGLGKGPASKVSDEGSTTDGNTSALGGLMDLHIEDRLQQHMDGGRRPPDSHLFPSAIPSPGDLHSRASRVLEGDQLNTGITGPGAALALALMYIRSENQEVARRLELPTTASALDSVRPDILLFRSAARCLVLWGQVEASEEWLENQVPEVVKRTLFTQHTAAKRSADTANKVAYSSAMGAKASGEDIDSKAPRSQTAVKNASLPGRYLNGRSALNQYLNITTGHCWGMGLVFAGTGDLQARDALLAKLRMLQTFRENKVPFPLSFVPDAKKLRPTLEMCIGTVALALACVMAGTGDVASLRILRALRWRVDEVTYGMHLSIAMAIGILFLGGGSSSLRRDPQACACLLMATSPRFPARTVDNQFHLQALRHLYTLAVESRALHVVDADSGNAVSVDVEIELIDGQRLIRPAPCLLPELASVVAVRTPPTDTRQEDSKYFPVRMEIQHVRLQDSKNVKTSNNYLKGKNSCFAASCLQIPHPLYVKIKDLPSHVGVSWNAVFATSSAPLAVLRDLTLTRLAGCREQILLNAAYMKLQHGGDYDEQLHFLSMATPALEVSSVRNEENNTTGYMSHNDLAMRLFSLTPVMREIALPATKATVQGT